MGHAQPSRRSELRPSPSFALAKDRLAAYQARSNSMSERESSRTIPALALRAYHLPGNSWCDDWVQYFANNHPLFGICCHHRLHPVTAKWRLIHLVGSIVFGLAVTNIIWLWFIVNDQHDVNDPVLTISFGGGIRTGNSTVSTGNYTDTEYSNSTAEAALQGHQEIAVTEGMLILWTIGGGLHALFDNTVWYMTACVCCLPGQPLQCLYKYKWCGTYVVVLLVVIFTAVASFVVVLRASLEEDDMVDAGDLNSAGIVDDSIDLSNGIDRDREKYRFLLSYTVELLLALLVYYPVVGTILFTGILGCGRLPVLGGRPYEVECERKLQQRESRRSFKNGRKTSSNLV
jgi:hypothetical protein